MLEWLKERAKERSTWNGLSLLGLAIASLAKAPEIVPYAEAVGANADLIASGGILGAVVAVVTGGTQAMGKERK